MEKISLDKKTLRKFGITMGAAFAVIALVLLIRHKHNSFPALSLSAIMFISAFISPMLLKPLYIVWMKFAFVLSWINTRIILFIIFYLIFTPIGIIIKISGIDLLNRKIEKSRGSYWRKAAGKPFNRSNYERQF